MSRARPPGALLLPGFPAAAADVPGASLVAAVPRRRRPAASAPSHTPHGAFPEPRSRVGHFHLRHLLASDIDDIHFRHGALSPFSTRRRFPTSFASWPPKRALGLPGTAPLIARGSPRGGYPRSPSSAGLPGGPPYAPASSGPATRGKDRSSPRSTRGPGGTSIRGWRAPAGNATVFMTPQKPLPLGDPDHVHPSPTLEIFDRDLLPESESLRIGPPGTPADTGRSACRLSEVALARAWSASWRSLALKPSCTAAYCPVPGS